MIAFVIDDMNIGHFSGPKRFWIEYFLDVLYLDQDFFGLEICVDSIDGVIQYIMKPCHSD